MMQSPMFGLGAPTLQVKQGQLYFDTSSMPFIPWIWEVVDGVAGWNQVSGIRIHPQEITDTQYTLVNGDDYLMFVSANPVTVTIPADTGNPKLDFRDGSVVNITQNGVGQVTLVGASRVTVNSLNAKFSVAGQYGVVAAIKEGPDVWKLVGSTA